MSEQEAAPPTEGNFVRRSLLSAYDPDAERKALVKAILGTDGAEIYLFFHDAEYHAAIVLLAEHLLADVIPAWREAIAVAPFANAQRIRSNWVARQPGPGL